MAITFQSIRSSSSGNCLLIKTKSTTLLIDCGLGSMKKTRQALKEASLEPSDIDAVLVSHIHGDHISYYPLRVLEQENIPLRIHQKNLKPIVKKHFTGGGLKNLSLEAFASEPFEIGDLSIEPFEVPHNPMYQTHGFVIRHENKKIVIATDFSDWQEQLDYFVDADFIFVEANYDLQLLQQHYNPNSLYHMPNPETAKLLCNVIKNSESIPKTVMLGHISNQRNTRKIALKEVRTAFKKNKMDIDFNLLAAHLYELSEPIEI